MSEFVGSQGLTSHEDVRCALKADLGYGALWGIPVAQGGRVSFNDADAAMLVKSASGLATTTTRTLGSAVKTAGKAALVAGVVTVGVLALIKLLSAVARSDRTVYPTGNVVSYGHRLRRVGECLLEKQARERDEIWNVQAPRTTLDRFCRVRTPNRLVHGVCVTPSLVFDAGGRVEMPISKIVYLGYGQLGRFYVITDDHQYYEFEGDGDDLAPLRDLAWAPDRGPVRADDGGGGRLPAAEQPPAPGRGSDAPSSPSADD